MPQIAEKRVLRVFHSVADHLRILQFEAPDGTLHRIETTDEHLFWVIEEQLWISADELELGDRVRGPSGELQALVSSVREERPGGVPVYNFEVEDFHTYFVIGKGPRGPPVLVHNTCAPRGAGRRGNKATQDHIDQVRDEFLAANPDYRHVAGGRNRVTGAALPEEYLPPLHGGRRGGSYPDLTFEGPHGGRVRINTTDTRVDGTMTPREQANFDRIFEQTGEPIISIPKPR